MSDDDKKSKPKREKVPKAPKLRLKITQEILDAAERRNSGHCAIANALRVAQPDAKHISVDVQTVRFTGKRFRYTYLTPRIAQIHIVEFDKGTKSVPFEFQLRSGQVTRSGNTRAPRRALTEKERQRREKSAAHMNEQLRLARMVQRNKGVRAGVPDRVGGKTPPLQTSADDVPFSRRRAYGLRGLEY